MTNVIIKILRYKEKIGLKFRIVLFATLSLWAVFLAGIGAWALFTNGLVKKQLGHKALAVVNTASIQIERLGHHKIKKPSDAALPEYKNIIETLRRVGAHTPFVRYIYTARIAGDNRMYFIVDPEENRDIDRDGKISPKEMRQPIGTLYDEPPEKYPECMSAMDGHADVNLNFVRDKWGKWISAAAPLRGPDGKVEAVLAADVSVDEFTNQRKQATKLILSVSFAAAGIGGFLLALALAVFVTRPLKEMELTARRIAEGNYSREIKMTGPAELGILVRSFNNMRNKVFTDRERIARDLHDGLIQIIRAAIFQVEYIVKKPDALGEELPKLKKYLDTAIEEIRKIILELTPAKLIEKGLIPAMRHYAQKVKESGGMDYGFETNLPDDFSFPVEEELIKIYLEALNNIKFNSAASKFEVVFNRARSGLELNISDNGKGFDVDTALKRLNKYGIKNMTDRAETNGWKLVITSAEGKGTSIYLAIPAN